MVPKKILSNQLVTSNLDLNIIPGKCSTWPAITFPFATCSYPDRESHFGSFPKSALLPSAAVVNHSQNMSDQDQQSSEPICRKGSHRRHQQPPINFVDQIFILRRHFQQIKLNDKPQEQNPCRRWFIRCRCKQGLRFLPCSAFAIRERRDQETDFTENPF